MTTAMLMISIDGGPLVAGSIREEYDGRLRDWSGEVQAAHMTCQNITVMAITGTELAIGQAVTVDCVINSDGWAVSRFQGNGPLNRIDFPTLAKILNRER